MMSRLTKITVVILTSGIFIACEASTKTPSASKYVPSVCVPEFRKDNITIPDSLKDGAHSYEGAVQLIALRNRVEDSHIGEAGVESKVYNAFEQIKDQATTAQLMSLLKHDAAAIRVYAFAALCDRDPSAKRSVLMEVKKPDELVTMMNGCSVSEATVRELCLKPSFTIGPVEQEVPTR